jgi:hypothetical protein
MRPCNRGWIARRQRKRRSPRTNQPAARSARLPKSPGGSGLDANHLKQIAVRRRQFHEYALDQVALVPAPRRQAGGGPRGKKIGPEDDYGVGDRRGFGPAGQTLGKDASPGSRRQKLACRRGQGNTGRGRGHRLPFIPSGLPKTDDGRKASAVATAAGAAPAILGKQGRPTVAGSALLKAWRFLQDADKIIFNGRKRTFTVHLKDGSFRMFQVVGQAGKSRLVDITYGAAGLRLLNSLPAVDESDA